MRLESAHVCILSVTDHKALRKCTRSCLICFLIGPRTTCTEKVLEFFFYLFFNWTTDHMHSENEWVCLLSVIGADHRPHSLRKRTSLYFICFLSGPWNTCNEKMHEFVFYLFMKRTTDHMRSESAYACLLSVFWADHGPHTLRKCLSLFFIWFLSRPRTTSTEKAHVFSFNLLSERTTCTEKMHKFVFYLFPRFCLCSS
jgi:hypothetical protein